MNGAAIHLAQAQLTAAWVSAGAAVVQAIGAVAAIVAAVILATQSARREKEASAAAERRAALADERAEARLVEADRAADARAHRERDAAHNSIIDRFLALARAVSVDLEAQHQHDRAVNGGSLAMINGSLGGRVMQSLRAAIPDLMRETDDANLMLAFDAFEAKLGSLNYGGQGWAAYEEQRSAVVYRFEDAVASVAALRR